MISNGTELKALIDELNQSPWVAVDTEADSLHAYPEKICLIQISSVGGDAIIDPLAGFDLKPLWEALQDRQLILHGADYDLRMLRGSYNFIPSSIFDTMIAARLLGDLQFGLGHLAEKYLNVQLEKGPQKMNWAMRPLTERMLTYAQNDTHYLKQLSDIIRIQLIAKGRLHWMEESCSQLVRDCGRPKVVDRQLQWRLKGTDRLDRRAQAVVRELFYWRELEAIGANLPPYFIMSHELLIRIAGAADEGNYSANLLPPRFSANRRVGVGEAISRALASPNQEWPKKIWQPSYHPTSDDKQRFEEIKLVRDSTASIHQIDPTLIASKAMLTQCSQGENPDRSGLLPWQADLLFNKQPTASP